MADEQDREPTPQEAQRDGQSAISQDSPLRELHQEVGENSVVTGTLRPTTPELTDEEVSALCDIEIRWLDQIAQTASGAEFSRAGLSGSLRGATWAGQAYGTRSAAFK